MINKLILEIKNMDMPIVKAMKVGFKISFVLCLFSSLILFRTGLFFAVSSFMSAFVINKIK